MYRWDELPEKEVNQHYNRLKKTKFPTPSYKREEAETKITSFKKYADKNKPLYQGDTVGRSFYGSTLIHPYHPHRYSERTTEDISVKDAWKDPYRLRRAIKLTAGDKKEINRQTVARTYGKYKLGRSPAYFSPAQSLAVIKRYSKEGDTVLDPFIGYGGSIPAAAVANRKIIGNDISSKSVKGNKKMASDLRRVLKIPKNHINITRGDVNHQLGKLPEQSIDLIYTSPPYYNRELYSGNGQSHKIKSYRQWLKEFYGPSIKSMRRVVKVGGRVAINIAPVKEKGKLKYPIDEDTIRLARRHGLKLEARHKLSLGIYRRGVSGKNHNEQKTEPILVFKKQKA